MSAVSVKTIGWQQILPVWQHKLWHHRQSAIEPQSAMTWPFQGDPEPINMSIFEFEPVFWGVFMDSKLVGVNSGHRTSDTQYRSRGIWVDPDYRTQGIAQQLFEHTQQQAISENCEMLWSIPRRTALRAYEKFGFQTHGVWHHTETSDANIYVNKII